MTEATIPNNGIHHLAVATKDIKTQIEFFNDVLGCELVALYWMHGVEGAWHGFMKMSETCSVAFVQTPQMADVESTLGVTHSGNGAGPCAPGTMQHLAFNVDSHEDLLAVRDRIRSRDITVFGPIDHGMCHSIYFAGPEDLSLEYAYSEKPIDGRAWVDPEVVGLAGISEDELERYRNPVADAPSDTAVPQPAFDPNLPWQRGFGEEVYQRIISMPDDVLAARMDFADPPVQVED
jgi:catechol 2,3-dioxygenase-like lactoylglutathione lyase family enzyme